MTIAFSTLSEVAQVDSIDKMTVHAAVIYLSSPVYPTASGTAPA